MKRFPTFHVALVISAMFALALAASADTLEMKDGRLIQGKYMGGTQTHVRFEVNGKIDQYAVDQIVALTFTGGDPSAATMPRNDLAPTPAAVPASSRHATSTETVTVPAGATILVRMIDSVDSEKNRIGDKFRASLESDLVADGVVVARKGTDVYGRLAEAKGAGHISGKSELKLELTDILINQQLQPIMTGDYDVSGKGRGKNTAEKVGGGAAVGAIIGAIAGGGKGAAIGAGVGAGAGTAINVVTKGQQVRVPSETLLEFRLQQPFTTVPSNTTSR